MNVKLFPGGRVHSAYLEIVSHPPEGVRYFGVHEYSPGSSYDGGFKDTGRALFDTFNLPYIFNVGYYEFVHSCQKIVNTKSDFVIDIEHGNPFMGAYKIDKSNYIQFRLAVKHFLLRPNCKWVLPWSEVAAGAFRKNFSFLGEEFLRDKVKVVYPAVSVPMGVKQDKFDRFTFIFVGGDAQYAKGVIQVIRAFRELKETYDCDLIVVSSGVTELQTLFDPIDGIKYFAPMPREDLMRMIGKSHCMLLPSVGDTFGMVLLEAKARKIPAIVYDSFSAKEIIEDGKTGLVIAPDYNLNLWFDEDGIKRFNKGAFHSQFIGGRFNPSNFGTGELLIAMKYMVDNTSNTKKMGIAGFKDVESGNFSIGERNRGLKDVYGGGSK